MPGPCQPCRFDRHVWAGIGLAGAVFYGAAYSVRGLGRAPLNIYAADQHDWLVLWHNPDIETWAVPLDSTQRSVYLYQDQKEFQAGGLKHRTRNHTNNYENAEYSDENITR